MVNGVTDFLLRILEINILILPVLAILVQAISTAFDKEDSPANIGMMLRYAALGIVLIVGSSFAIVMLLISVTLDQLEFPPLVSSDALWLVIGLSLSPIGIAFVAFASFSLIEGLRNSYTEDGRDGDEGNKTPFWKRMFPSETNGDEQPEDEQQSEDLETNDPAKKGANEQ
jgi:hypothetical protein